MSAFNVFRKPLTVKRPAGGSYVNGKWVESGAPSEITIKASVQPATTEDLQSLPENRRQYGAYRVYSSTQFQSLEEDENNPDVVVIGGNDYEIAQVQPWQNGIVPHYKAIAVRVQPE